MASPGDLQEDLSPRLLPPLVQRSDERSPRKQFDIRLSRVPLPKEASKESMLVYSEHARQVHQSRRGRNPRVAQLSLRAHHAPKYTSSINTRLKRKTLSLNELIEKRKNPITDRRQSSTRSLSSLLPTKHVKISFVSASDLHDILDCSFKSKGSRSDSLRLSLWESTLPASTTPWVHDPAGNDIHRGAESESLPNSHSAHDHETTESELLTNSHIPSSMLSRRTHKSAFPLLKHEGDNESNARDANDPPVSTDDIRVSTIPSLPQITQSREVTTKMTTSKLLVPQRRSGKGGILRHRPRRARRMTLHEPELGVIHEGENDGDVGARSVPLPSKTSLAAIKESRSSLSGGDVKISLIDIQSLFAPMVSENVPNVTESELDSSISIKPHITNDFREQPEKPLSQSKGSALIKKADSDRISKDKEVSSSDTFKTNKSKAAKKMNKLIFLRDFPDKHYHRK